MMIKGDGPIPGENFTSDTKNYPWHQPPEFVDLGKALDKLSMKLTDKKTVNSLVTTMEMGFPLVSVAQLILMEGVGQGKWTVDLALLMAGPTTKILQIIADNFEIEYDLGLDDEDDTPSGTFLKGLNELEEAAKNKGVFKLVQDQLPQMAEAAEEGEGSTEDPDASAEGEEDLAEGGFAAMTGNAPGGGKAAPPPEEGLPEDAAAAATAPEAAVEGSVPSEAETQVEPTTPLPEAPQPEEVVQ